MAFFQSSFGIPAEGVYAGLVLLLLIAIVVMAIAIHKLVQGLRKVTIGSIEALREVTAVLNATREQMQVGGNEIMGGQRASEKRIISGQDASEGRLHGQQERTERKIYDQMIANQLALLKQLEFLRDKAK